MVGIKHTNHSERKGRSVNKNEDKWRAVRRRREKHKERERRRGSTAEGRTFHSATNNTLMFALAIPAHTCKGPLGKKKEKLTVSHKRGKQGSLKVWFGCQRLTHIFHAH